MKSFLLLVISFTIALFSCAETNAYLNCDGVFKKYPKEQWKSNNLPPLEIQGEIRKPGTIAYIPTKLGFLPDEWYMWFTNDYKFTFVFKSFSDEIIYILTDSDAEIISAETIARRLSDFDYEKDFGDRERSKILEGRIRQSFLEDVLQQKSVGGTITDNRNGYVYHFKDGFLDSYIPLDGLSEIARSFKDYEIYTIIEKNAKRKHNTEEDAVKEINFQFACMYMMEPKHIKLAYNRVYDYNIALVWFAIYGVSNSAKLEDFQLIAPDATPFDIAGNKITMTWGSNLFYFENGVLKSVK